MRGLIIKDLKLLRFAWLFAIILGLIFAYIGTASIMVYKSQLIFGYGIFILSYIGIMFLTQWELKSKSHIIFNSFPIKRDEIVKARYIVVLLYLLFILAIIYLGSNIIMLLSATTIGEPARIMDILFIACLCLIFFSIYLPFEYYYLGKTQVLNSVFYLMAMLLPNMVNAYSDEILNSRIYLQLIKFDFISNTYFLIGIGTIIYILSLQLSKKIYSRKEF